MKSLGEKAAGAMAWNLAGKLYFTAAKYVESILLFRLLGAGEYGVLASVLNAQATFVTFASLGLGNAVLKFLPRVRESGGDEIRFMRRMIAMRVALGLIGAAALFVFAPFLAKEGAGGAGRASLFQVAALLVVTTSLQNLLIRFFVSTYRQKRLNIIQSAVQTLYVAAAATVLVLGGGVLAVLAVNVG
ncbi:oligosaccharide flippase family protein, partial [bacterium]|nr:oligosaccharide flippase family protein [bacterium]